MAVDVGSAVGYLDLDISGFLKNLRSAQSEADKTTKNMATAMGGKLQSVGSALSSTGKAMTTAVTTPIVGLATAAIKTSSNFESAMSKVSAISGATGDDLDALNVKAQEMGAKTKFSATESAEAFTYMAMAGWKTEDMLDGIDGIMALAAADGLDLATTSDIVTDALTAFGLGAGDSGHFADVLASAASNANTNVSLLGESFKYAAPVAGALGYSAEDTAIALGLMANAGIKGSQGGTALRSSLSRLIKPTDDAAALMEQYGISMTNADGSMKSLGEVMDMLRTNLGGLDEAEQAQVATTLFGQEAMSGMLAIINASESDYGKLTGAIYDADGAAQTMADTMMDNLEGQITLLKSALEGLAIQFGEILMPYIKQFVEWLQNLVEKFQQLTPEQKEQIVKWAAIAAAIGPALLVVGKVVGTVGKVVTVFGKVAGAIEKAGGIVKIFSGILGGISAPVVAVVAIIGTLVAAFLTLWNTNEEFREKITAIWDGIKQKFVDFAQGIVDRLNELGFNFEDITEVLGAIWNGFCELLAPVFEGAFEAISITLGTVLDVLTGLLDVFIGLFTGNWEQVWNGVKEIFDGIWDGIKATFENILNTIKGIIDVFLGWAGTSWDEVWTNIKTFFEGIWNGIVSFVTGVLDTIKTTFENIWNGITDFLSSAWETIKNVVQVGIMFVVELLKAAFQLITLPFRFIWENCKEVILAAWEKIKTTVSNAINAIKAVIEKVWNAIVSFLGPILEGIKTTVANVWNAIKTTITTVVNNIKATISNVFNAVKTTISNVFDAIKTTASNIWNGIKSAIETPINAAKTTITNVVNAIKSIISNGFNAAKSTVSNIFNGIKNTISNVLNSAKSVVSNAIENIKSKFNFTWSLPKLKLPHPRISGRFSLNPPSVPHFSIEWYKKAMNNGMVLDAATIFGFNSKTGNFMGAGEAGSETIVGTKNLLQMIKNAVDESNTKIVKKLSNCIGILYGRMRTFQLEVIPAAGLEKILQSFDWEHGGGFDYDRLAAKLAQILATAPIQPNINVEMEDGDVYLDNERVGRKVAPVVSRVVALEER